ncbi:MAG: arsenite efflux transporter metallochaperone ArsD [Eubacteriales bacterium]|nr:arsenite efflux transporter metallochaperone ArsD [Eubacteriales bacterium]
MKKMYIYEPAMCCPTGLCGVGIDQELLNLSTLIANLEKKGIKVERYNLTNSPQEFVNNKEINDLIMEKGIEILPVTLVEGVIVKTGGYPNKEEITEFLGMSEDLIIQEESSDGGCCGGGCC